MYQVLGLFHSMEVVQLPVRRMYWETKEDGLFPGLNCGATMSRNRFEEIIAVLQFSESDKKDKQIMDFIAAVNERFNEAMSPGYKLTIDESMVKAYRRNLKGKMYSEAAPYWQ